MEDKAINKISVLIFRVMLSLIFLVAAINHLFEPGKAVHRLAESKMGFLATTFVSPEVLVMLAGIGLLVGGLSLIADFKTKFAAALLILIIIPITLTVQIGNPEGMGPLFKNIAITGALVFFLFNGSLFYGTDQIKNKKR